MAATLRETIAVACTGENCFRAEPFGRNARMGNPQPIAFGGIILGQVISAGFATLPTSNDGLELYSAQGTYLGPSSTDLPTFFSVESIRSTKRFCTRLVRAWQVLAGDESRPTMIALLDWQLAEPSMLTFSAPPMYPPYPLPDELVPFEQYVRGILSPKEEAIALTAFGLGVRLLDIRSCPESTGAKNVLGVKKLEDWDETIPIHKHNYASRVRARCDLTTQAEHCAALGFIMDMALSFIPLTFTNQPITAAAAVSSLEFSLRIFRPFDLTKWHLSELRTENGASARTFSVGKLYNDTGVEVASMSQASILRPKARL